MKVKVRHLAREGGSKRDSANRPRAAPSPVQRFSDRALHVVQLTTLVGCLAVLAGCDPLSTYGPLRPQWSSRIPSAIVAKATLAQGIVYVGGFNNGYEYSFADSSGALSWQTNLGTTTANCSPPTQGIASSPTVINGTAYLGGGDANWYALNSVTGLIQWSFPVGDNSATGGNFNYSSPLLYNGFAYVGTASFCDNPLVQGKLLRVDLTTHQVVAVWKAVPDGQVGGTIWSNPVVDPASNTVFVTTGTRARASQTYAEAFVALDATTLAVKGSWSPTSAACNVCDYDFGASPTLFSDSHSRQLVGAANKDGVFYALDRNNLNAGPVWQARIASGGACPTCGYGSISTAFSDGQRVYVAGGKDVINGQLYKGSVQALDPATGNVVWQVGLDSPVIGALAGLNGMIAVPDVSSLYVFDGASGKALYANNLGAQIFAAPLVANGQLIVGTADGVVHTLVFSGQPPAGVAASTATTARIAGTHALACLSRGSCRLTVGRRCLTLRAPTNTQTTVIATLKARLLDQTRHPEILRVYGNSACAGTPLLRLPVSKRLASYGASSPISVPAGTAIAIAAPRRLQLEIQAVIRAARPVPYASPIPLNLPAVFYGTRRHPIHAAERHP